MSDNKQMESDQIRAQLANELRNTTEKNKKLETVFMEKDKEAQELKERLKALEEMYGKTKSSLSFYQQQEQQKLKNKYDSVIKPFVSEIKNGVEDSGMKSKIDEFENTLSSQINAQDVDTSVIKMLEPTMTFVESVASASQIRASEYEKFVQKQKALLKDLQEKDTMLETKTKETAELMSQLEMVQKAKEEELKKIQEERDAEVAKVKEELKKYQESLEQANKNINNTEAHVEQMETSEDKEQETQQQNSNMAPDVLAAARSLYEEPPVMNHMQPTSYTTAVAGANGVGSFNDLLKVGRAPSDSWRKINLKLSKDMFTENVYQTYRKRNEQD